jgi:hypothetical protein
VIGKERVIDDFQDLARAASQHNVFRLDAMMFSDSVDDPTVGVPIPVCVFPRIVHCIHHRLGWAIGILVVGKFREFVVVGFFVKRCFGSRGRLLGTCLSGNSQFR